MSVRPLVQLGSSHFHTKQTALREPSQLVTEFGPELLGVLVDLLDTFESHKIAVGLAAPQVGIPLRLAVINIQRDRAEPTLVIINPKIISSGGKKDKKKEACLSLPDFQGEVERRHKLSISYQDRFGKSEVIQAEGFLARVLFHEIDHLDGVLYVDRMNPSSTLEPAGFFRQE